jgi:SET domain-containing protein
MSYLDKFLYIKKSNLPNGGKGLFTKVDIPKGTRITEYKGKFTTWAEVESLFDNGYYFHIDDETVINAMDDLNSFGRYANDAKGLSKVKGLANNADYTIEGKKVFIDAKKNIKNGEEILVPYGADYWKQVRYNINWDKKELKDKEVNV